MLDSDLAELYQVTTGNLNLAVRRNARRFPQDFMFQLAKGEAGVFALAICNSKNWPRWEANRAVRLHRARRGHAVVRAAQRPRRAGESSIMRAFVHLRELMASQKDIAHKIDQLEAGQKQHGIILEASTVSDIQKLRRPPLTKAIGFAAPTIKTLRHLQTNHVPVVFHKILSPWSVRSW